MHLVENATDYRVLAFDGSDITDQCEITGDIPRLELRTTPGVATRISDVALHSPRSGLWPKVHLGDRERLALYDGDTIHIDARVRYTDER